MRPRTISLRLPVLQEDGASYPRGARRPETRGDCVDGPRPCPWVGCKYSLFLDVTKAGSLKLNFPSDSLDGLVDNLMALEHSCALDVAGGKSGDGDGVTLEDVGAMMNVTRERIRQMEEKFKARLSVEPAVKAALGISGDEYWRTGEMPAMLPGEAARRLRRSEGHASLALLEVPEDLFELGDEDAAREGDDAPDRSSGVRTTDGQVVPAEREPEARRSAG
jgi:sigma-70-like protein